MNAFSNNNIKDKLCGGCDCTGFVPKVDFSLNTGTKVLTLTDASTYPSADGRKVVRGRVSDDFAGEVIFSIPANDSDGVITADLTSLNASRGLTIQATVVTNKGCTSDGIFYHLGIHANAGSLASWDKDNDAITV